MIAPLGLMSQVPKPLEQLDRGFALNAARQIRDRNLGRYLDDDVYVVRLTLNSTTSQPAHPKYRMDPFIGCLSNRTRKGSIPILWMKINLSSQLLKIAGYPLVSLAS